MSRRGYSVEGAPQQRTLPNIHNKDDKFAIIYHLSKEVPLKRADTLRTSTETLPPGTGPTHSTTPPPTASLPSAPLVTTGSPELLRQTNGELLNAKKLRFSPQLGPPAVLKKIQHPYYSQTIEYQNSKM